MSVDKALMYYVRWDSSITNSVSLKHFDCYYSFSDLLEYIRLNGNFEEIEKFLVEYKIPYAISHIFSILSRDRNFHEDLFKFLNQDKVRKDLKMYRLQRFDKNSIRYLIQCKGIEYCPKMFSKVFARLK